MEKKIKLFDPFVGNSEEKAVMKVLKSKFWASGAGVGNVSKFEEAFRKFTGSDCCVALNSGTAALHLALSLVNIRNKEVILPSLSFISTALAVLYNGGKPVFVDIEPETLCINHELVEKNITRRTKVILPVHFGGMPCNLNAISNLCKQNKIILIEDAAHAAGTTYKNKKIGAHGTAVCFSFHPVKNLAMPTGGAITLNGRNSENFSKILKALRWCGISNRNGPIYGVEELGWNYYMNEFSAAIGIEQLKKLDRLNSIRRKIVKRYSRELQVYKKMPYSENCSYHLYWIQVRNRDNFMKRMKKEGIETGIHYLPIHKMKLFSIGKKLHVTEQVSKHIVSIPLHPNLRDSDVTRIIKLTNKLS